MKIFISLNNYWGANVWGSRLIEHLNFHDIKTAAFYKNHIALNNFDFCLDAIFFREQVKKKFVNEFFGFKTKKMNYENVGLIFDEMIEWEPDLIISDVELFSANLALTLEVELWYCSPLLLLTGIKWPNLIPKYKKQLVNLPKASRQLIYSPFGDLGLDKKDGFEWIKPYHSLENKTFISDSEIKNSIGLNYLQRFNNFNICSSETSYLSDMIYQEKQFVSLTNIEDIEQFTNGKVIHDFQLGNDIKGIHKSPELIKDLEINDCSFKLNKLSSEFHELL